MATSLIPSVAYLRKSTAGANGRGGEKQEASLPTQQAAVGKLQPAEPKAAYKVLTTYEDVGKSGWKRGNARPGFARMLTDIQRDRNVQAILVDDLDRFSRGDVLEVVADLSTLAACGVKFIHAVNQGIYALGDGDIGKIIKMVVDVHGSNDSSRKLGRRLARSRRDRAVEGKRSGGPAPYGYMKDGAAGLVVNVEQAPLVKRIFAEFAGGRSLRGIAKTLNAEKIPSPRGGIWAVETLRIMLKNAVYVGKFEFGRKPAGRFWQVRGSELTEASSDVAGTAPITHDKHYPAIVAPAMFATCERRFARSAGQYASSRTGGHLLSGGILVCEHCDQAMYGTVSPQGILYRCTTQAKSGTCGNYLIKEDQIAPFIFEALGREIEAIAALKPQLPELTDGATSAAALQKRADALKAKIARGVRNLLEVEDAQSRQEMDAAIKAMREELAVLLQRLNPQHEDQEQTQREALAAWWADFCRRAVKVPVPATARKAAKAAASAAQRADYRLGVCTLAVDGTAKLMVDPVQLHEALLMLGCQVTLRWSSTSRISKTGRTMYRYTLERGRLRLGTQMHSGQFGSSR